MNFAYDEVLFYLLAVPALVLFFIYASRRRAILVARFCQPHLAGEIMLPASRVVHFFKTLMILVAVGFIIVALAGPRWGFRFEEVLGRSATVVIALDLSRSMLAEDSKPNRLARAKREIFDLLDILEGERVGLVGFAGAAYIQSPLTVDYQALKSFVEVMDPDSSISSSGSDIGLALKTAMKLFKEGDEGAIILITDGEDFEGRMLKEAREAKKAGIKIYAIGTGKPEGAPIPEMGGFKKDRSGGLVITRLNERLLQKVTELTGGNYVRSVTGDEDIDIVYRQGIRGRIGVVEYAMTKRKVWEERFQWFILPAIIMLFMEKRVSGLKRGARWTGLAVLMVILSPAILQAGIFSSTADEGVALYESGEYDKALEKFLESEIDKPQDVEIKYNQGNSYYELKKYREAEKKFRNVLGSAQEDNSIGAQSLYNMGNVLYREGRLEKAAEAFKRVLEIDPGDEDSKHNLELTQKRIALSRQAPQQNEKGDAQDGSSSDDVNQAENEQADGEQGENSSRQEGSDPKDAGSNEMENTRAADGNGGEPDDNPDAKIEAQDSSQPPGDQSSAVQGSPLTDKIREEDIKRLLGSVREGKIIRPGSAKAQNSSTKDW